MLSKRILVVMIVLVLSVFLVGCGTCPEIPEYECPDCDCSECPDCDCPEYPDCPDCVCPDIPPCALVGDLEAVNFGWVDYDTGLGWLTGYYTGWGLIDATVADIHSIVVKLYSGGTLLQTNTATPKVVADLSAETTFGGSFDVFGTFDYVTDGYWVNVRESEYGQSIDATKVVATVTLNNSKVVTAENTNPTNIPIP